MHPKHRRHMLLEKVPVVRKRASGDSDASFLVVAVVDNAGFARPDASWQPRQQQLRADRLLQEDTLLLKPVGGSKYLGPSAAAVPVVYAVFFAAVAFARYGPFSSP